MPTCGLYTLVYGHRRRVGRGGERQTEIDREEAEERLP